MENKKIPITHELILYRYKRSLLGFVDPKAYPVVFVLMAAMLFGIYYFAKHKTTTISGWIYLCVFGGIILLFLLYKSIEYSKINKQQYQVVTDHLKRKFNPVVEPLRYRRTTDDFTRFFEFRKYGKCPAYDWSIHKHRSQTEGEVHYNYHNSEIGDKFYLVVLGKRILQVYSDRSYCLPEETQE